MPYEYKLYDVRWYVESLLYSSHYCVVRMAAKYCFFFTFYFHAMQIYWQLINVNVSASMHTHTRTPIHEFVIQSIKANQREIISEMESNEQCSKRKFNVAVLRPFTETIAR